MPIDYKEYHPKWTLISRLIRIRRAKNRCEWCGLGNYLVCRTNKVDGSFQISHYNWSEADTYARAKQHKKHIHEACDDGEGKWYIVVLTVAHIDHDKTNNRFGNLAALCQKCHLNHDRSHHIMNRKYGRNHKKYQLKLL